VRDIASRHGAAPVEIGRVTEEPRFRVERGGRAVIHLDLAAMKAAWTRGLAEALQ
jgi:phosphoribosylformylglycinamidine (FGAM) synthase-like enzyme